MRRHKRTIRCTKSSRTRAKICDPPSSHTAHSPSYWVFENGRLAETRGGRQLIFNDRLVAEAVALVVFGEVREGRDIKPEQRGRKIDVRVMKARAQLEMAEHDHKPTLHALNEKYFGPFQTQEARLRSRERLKKAIQYLRKREEHQRLSSEHLLAI